MPGLASRARSSFLNYRSFASESKSWLCCRQGRFTHGIKGAACVVPPVGPWTLKKAQSSSNKKRLSQQQILKSSYLQNTIEYLQNTLEKCIFCDFGPWRASCSHRKVPNPAALAGS